MTYKYPNLQADWKQQRDSSVSYVVYSFCHLVVFRRRRDEHRRSGHCLKMEANTECDLIAIWHAMKRREECIKKQKMREEGIEPTTAGTGIQRSTTELFPHTDRHTPSQPNTHTRQQQTLPHTQNSAPHASHLTHSMPSSSPLRCN